MRFKHRHHLPLLATAASALITLFAAPSASAQTFALSDGAGDPTSGTYSAGSQFTLSVTFTTPVSSTGYSLWLDTASSTAPQLSIVSFTLTSTAFPDRITGNGSQAFNTANSGRPGFLSNPNDLGAIVDNPNAPVAAGSYQVETIVLQLGSGLAPGTYTLQTTPAASGGRASGNSDANFDFTTAPSAAYTFNVVPEPASWSLLGLGAVGTGVMVLRRRRTA